MIETDIQNARASVVQLLEGDSRRVIALGRLALADELVRQARVAVQEAVDEIASSPEEFQDDTFRGGADVRPPVDDLRAEGEIGVKPPTETVRVEQVGWSG